MTKKRRGEPAARDTQNLALVPRGGADAPPVPARRYGESAARSWGCMKSTRGPAGTMRVGLTVSWLA